MSWRGDRLAAAKTEAAADYDPKPGAAPDPDGGIVAAGLAALLLAIEPGPVSGAKGRRSRTSLLPSERRAAAIHGARQLDALCAKLNPPMLAIAVMLAVAFEVFSSNQVLLRLHPEWAPAPIDVEIGIPNASVTAPR